MGPLFLAPGPRHAGAGKVATLGDLRFASRIFAALRAGWMVHTRNEYEHFHKNSGGGILETSMRSIISVIIERYGQQKRLLCVFRDPD